MTTHDWASLGLAPLRRDSRPFGGFAASARAVRDYLRGQGGCDFALWEQADDQSVVLGPFGHREVRLAPLGETPADTELIELASRLLSTILAAELQTAAALRRAGQAEAESLVEPLTGLANRRAWERHLQAEEDRCQRSGTVASILVIDLDELKRVNDTGGHLAGDELLRRTGRALVRASRGVDLVARLGGDEFGILAVDCPSSDAEMLVARVGAALLGEGIAASLGVATRLPAATLEEAWARADSYLYEAKRRV